MERSLFSSLPSPLLLPSPSPTSSSRFTRNFVIRSSLRRSDNDKVTTTREEFLKVYPKLKSQLLEGSETFTHTKESRRWVEEMLDYNVPAGKFLRSFSIIDNLRLMNGGKELEEDEKFLAFVLGWCIEWLQAYILIMDDMMDNSITRRGKLCWYKNPQVGMIAVNDALMLANQVSRLLKMYFQSKPYYLELLDLFNEAQFQTCAGQMLDMIVTSSSHGTVNVSNYMDSMYSKTAHSKTGYYTFYLPVACSLLLRGKSLENYKLIKNIINLMGTYLQVHDDYLGCYGDHAIIGKAGTDIEDCKCTWLIIQAIKRANKDQKKCLLDNYGKRDPACVANVKMIYNEVALKSIFKDYKERTIKRIHAEVQSIEDQTLQVMLTSIIQKYQAVFDMHLLTCT